eukprot:CAMPEP_0167751982 /NCGR_PEP_ID=MMETSP0110_2-20121227/6880_1 /TAXON_ID=629695 /ORGANISM="Gymnochlora sp., Strain CCMP2014" /LENGTH=159 /DNA_ID=CAMNT_0007637537 /DNA_START=82 /DNA_END=561 /DNA_ORIENTATION=+
MLKAAKKGDIEKVKELIANGVAASYQNKIGYNGLIYASRGNKLDLVKYFALEKKVNVEAKDKYGQTALAHAAHTGSLAVVKFLAKEMKADVDTKGNYGHTPLIEAASRNHAGVVEFLVEECNANLEAKYNGMTAYDWAKEESCGRVLIYLEQSNKLKLN